ncbi:MAG: hypothetical protein J7L61_04005 [Thermoplasmata archaeon]|nr:hypothetical protein [Thermoplasmata archaeon]
MNRKSETNVMSTPREIREFFSKQGGRSLLIKGGPGTGKTTFALQYLEENTHPEKSVYLSTRVSDESLYQHFPWLREKDMEARIMDSSKILLEALYPEEGGEEIVEEMDHRVEAARDFLKSIKGEGEAPHKVDRRMLAVLLEQNRVPEIERVYDKVNSILPEKTTVVIDSVEGITHKYNFDQEEFVMVIQKDLVENSNTNVIFVLEKPEAQNLEYLVDGVVQLKCWYHEGRIVREIRMEKLRATEIRQPSYLLTLQGGRFTLFEPFENHKKTSAWTPIENPQGKYTTGIADLDTLLGGGLKKGSYTVLEVDNSVENKHYQAILRPLFLNFLVTGGGITAVLPGGHHPETMRNDMVQYIRPDVFDKNVRILDHFIPRSDKEYVVALGDPKEAPANYRNAMRALDGKPILDYTGFDTLEYLMGNKIQISELLTGVAKLKVSENLGIGVLKPGLKLAQEVVNMADVYLKMTTIGRTPVIYGVKPSTTIYALTVDDEKGLPYMRLTPLV